MGAGIFFDEPDDLRSDALSGGALDSFEARRGVCQQAIYFLNEILPELI